MFRDWNQKVIENYGGPTYATSPAEFDSVNRKYDTRVDTIAEALWVTMPKDRPYCIDDIDLDALNDTSPARESRDQLGIEFELPDFVHEEILIQQEREAMHERAAGEMPKDWKTRCRSWKKQELEKSRKVASDCYSGKGKKERCVCRNDRGSFVKCPVPRSGRSAVPF